MYLQGSAHHPKGSSGMARVTSYSILAALDTKMKKGRVKQGDRVMQG